MPTMPILPPTTAADDPDLLRLGELLRAAGVEPRAEHFDSSEQPLFSFDLPVENHGGGRGKLIAIATVFDGVATIILPNMGHLNTPEERAEDDEAAYWEEELRDWLIDASYGSGLFRAGVDAGDGEVRMTVAMPAAAATEEIVRRALAQLAERAAEWIALVGRVGITAARELTSAGRRDEDEGDPELVDGELHLPGNSRLQ